MSMGMVVPKSAHSSKWAPWVVAAVATSGEGVLDQDRLAAQVHTLLWEAGADGAEFSIHTATFHARKEGWLESPRRGLHRLTPSGVALSATLRATTPPVPVPATTPPVPVPATTPPVPVPVESVVCKVIDFPIPVKSAYDNMDEYIAGLAIAKTPCFGHYSERAKSSCGVCPLAHKCANHLWTRVAEVAATLEREVAEAEARRVAEAEARRVAEAEARRVAEAEARGVAEAEARGHAGGPFAASSHTEMGHKSFLVEHLSPQPLPAPTGVAFDSTQDGSTFLMTAFDAVCGKCRGVISRGSDARHIPGQGIYHLGCV